MFALLNAGKNDAAYRMQKETNTLLAVMMQAGWFPSLKHLLDVQGVPAGECRPPFLPISKEKKELVEQAYVECEKRMAELRAKDSIPE